MNILSVRLSFLQNCDGEREEMCFVLDWLGDHGSGV